MTEEMKRKEEIEKKKRNYIFIKKIQKGSTYGRKVQQVYYNSNYKKVNITE